MKNEIINPILALLFRARVNDRFFGGDDNYAKGKRLLAQLERRRKTTLWLVGIGGLIFVIAATFAAWWSYGARPSALAAVISGYVAATAFFAVSAAFRERQEKLLTRPPVSSRYPYELKWEDAPTAAAVESDKVSDDFDEILWLGHELGIEFPWDEVTTLVGMGKLLESVAGPAHRRVEEIERGSGNRAELEDLKTLLRLATPLGRKILTLVWDDQKEAHKQRMAGGAPRTTLMRLAPFSWPGLCD